MSMGDSLRTADITKTLMKHFLDEVQKLCSPWPVMGLNENSGIHDLVNDILENEDISEILLEKIGKVLGKRWMKWGNR